MKRASLTCLVAGLLGLLALSAVGPAEEPKENGKRDTAKPRAFVILVGISEYADKQIKPRPHAEKDVKALYRVFTDAERFTADKKDVTLLLGTEDENTTAKKATKKAFLDALKDAANNAGSDDLVVLAFVGQGGQLGDSGDRRCYFLADSTFKGRDKDAVAAEEIEESLKSLKCKKFCTFLDIDFTGFVDENKGGRAISEPTLGKAPYREFLGDDGSEDHLSLPGRVAFLATNGLTTSLDLKENGLFTKVIVDGLKGGADNEGYEGDGLVTIEELAKYVNKELPELARKHGKTEKEREQDHWVLSGPSSRFVLTTNPNAIKASRDRLATFDKLVADKKVTAEQAVEGRTLLERMPPLKKKQELRKAYQQFVDEKMTAEQFNTTRQKLLKSMELGREDAFAFANKILQVTDLLSEEYVKEVNVGQLIGYAIRETYNYLEEKLPDDIEKQLKDVKKMDERQLHALLADARQKLGNREDLEALKDLNIALKRMLHKLDPHTTYIDPETKKKWDDEIAGGFTGIGIQIRKDATTDQLLVATPILNAPAYKVQTPMSKADPKVRPGLWAGDIVTNITSDRDTNGKKVDQVQTTPTKGLPINKAVKMILGPPGTDVTLKVLRDGKEFDITITRGKVEVESVLGTRRKDDDSWDFMLDHANKIGYLRLSGFNKTSFRDLEKEVRDLISRHGMKGFILDLRFNPGGLLESAVRISDLFVDDGLIVSVHPRVGQGRGHFGRTTDSLLDFPMVCLINGDSASGSEIVSAALQDHNRALIFGERSYGKGSVQNMKPLDVKDPKTGDAMTAEIKYTWAAFRRPNGENLNKSSTGGKEEEKWGVVPDKIIKLTTKDRRDLYEHLRNLETIERADRRGKEKEKPGFVDRQLDAATRYLQGQIKLSSKLPVRKTSG